ncbi:MAG: hypothetical protein ACREP5_04880, partial [Candidatus Binatia bacterium]
MQGDELTRNACASVRFIFAIIHLSTLRLCPHCPDALSGGKPSPSRKVRYNNHAAHIETATLHQGIVMVSDPLISTDYWMDIQITSQDVEFLHNHLFELETPLTARELAAVFVNERVRAERLAAQTRREAGGKTYLPKEAHQIGDELVFPALNWKRGKVTAGRAGNNPDLGSFDVLTVELEDGSSRLFASNLAGHALNDGPVAVEDDGFDPDEILRAQGSELEKKLESAFSNDGQLVR